MPKIEGTLGSLLQGVSQQPTHIRVEGQLTDQVNFMSDVSTGLTSRPASNQLFEMPTAETDYQFYDFQLNQRDYVMAYKREVIRVFDLDGTEYPINVPRNSARNYIGNRMKFHVFNDDGEDKLYCVNNNFTVRPDPNEVIGYPFSTAIATTLGGNFSRTYSLQVVIDGSRYIARYITPDGTGSTDADETRSEYIIQQLRSSLLANNTVGQDASDGILLNDFPDANVVVEDDVLLIMLPSNHTVTITSNDGDGDTILRTMARTIEDTLDLPKYAPHGTVVRVVGDADEADDYFLRFENSADNTPVGQGFGTSGVWVETNNPEEISQLNSNSLPHKLTQTETGFEFDRGDWQGRRVGSEDTNPLPSFVNLRINDISGFEGRLVITAGPNVIMSRTNEPEDFFRKSALSIIASDPIDMKSTKDGSVTLDWIVPFDRDLILFSDPGDSQFVVTGGGITPDNASLVLTTSYEMSGDTRPVTTGRTIVFPFESGIYSGMKEFFTNDAISTNGADNLTDIQDRYIVGKVNNLVSSNNFNYLALTTGNSEYSNRIWIYKYLWEGSERRQASWSYWELSDEIRHLFFINSTLYAVVHDEGRFYVVGMNLNKEHDLEGFHITLDRKNRIPVEASNIIRREFSDAVIVQSNRCLNPGRETIPLSITQDGDEYIYQLNPRDCPVNSRVYTGRRVTREIEPTMPRIRDDSGTTISSARIVVQNFVVHLTESSDIQATMNCIYRQPYSFYPRRFPLDDEVGDPNQNLIMDYSLEIPWGERADLSSMVLTSRDVRPTTILEIEWQGQVTGTKRRV